MGQTSIPNVSNSNAINGLEEVEEVEDLIFDNILCDQSFHGHSDWIESIIHLPDKELLVSCGLDCVNVWDLATGERKKSYEHLAGYCALHFSKDCILIGKKNGDISQIKINDENEKELLEEISIFSDRKTVPSSPSSSRKPIVRCLCKITDDIFVSGSGSRKNEKGKLTIWDILNPEKSVRSFHDHEEKIRVLYVLKKRKFLLSGGGNQFRQKDFGIRVYDVFEEDQQNLITTFGMNEIKSEVTCIDSYITTKESQEKVIIGTSKERNIFIYDARTVKLERIVSFYSCDDASFTGIFSFLWINKEYVLVGTNHGNIMAVDFRQRKGKIIRELKVWKDHTSSISSIIWGKRKNGFRNERDDNDDDQSCIPFEFFSSSYDLSIKRYQNKKKKKTTKKSLN